jgi:nitrite reductase/ring-hydroxylating ferredoxin subunit/uncharacterized membrane protein
MHPMLVHFPIAFWTGAVVLDAVAWATGSAWWWTIGGYLAIAGIGGAILAAVPGLIDYLSRVPPKSSAKVRATQHMAVMLAVVTLFTAAWLTRAPIPAPQLPVLAIEVVALALLLVGGYLGGTLVVRNLIGVDPRQANAGPWREATVHATSDGTDVVVAAADELEVGQMKLIHLRGKRVVLGRTTQGYVAFDDRCTHRGGSLAGGVLVCGVVQCLWHGSQFDAATGRVVNGPATRGLATYRVENRDGQIMIVGTRPSVVAAAPDVVRTGTAHR